MRVDGLALSFLPPDEEVRLRLLDPDASDLEIYGSYERSGAMVLLAAVSLPGLDLLQARGGRCRVPVTGVPHACFSAECVAIQPDACDDEQDDDRPLAFVEVWVSHSLASDALPAASQALTAQPLTATTRRSMWSSRYLNAALVAVSVIALSGLGYQTGRVREYERHEDQGVVALDRATDNGALTPRAMAWPLNMRMRGGPASSLPASLTLTSADMNADAREQARQMRWRETFGTDPILQVASARTLRAELVDKGLAQSLIDARGYVLGGAANGNEKAVQLYLSIVAQLSASARDALHQSTLASAMSAMKAGRLEEAALRFQALFEDFMVPS